MKKIILLFIFSISFSFGQNIDTEKISEIDSIYSSINRLKSSEYKTIQSSGLIKKKKLIFFKKTIGSFNLDVIYINNEILKIRYVEFLNEEFKNEIYYFSKNKLIKYEIKSFDNIELFHNEINSKAYFENGKLIKFWSDKVTEFNALKILEKAKELNKSHLEFMDIK